MRRISIITLESDMDMIFEEISTGEQFVVCDEDGEPLGILKPCDEDLME